MKACKQNITLFKGFNLKLQISNIKTDTNGLVIDADGWTNFNDPRKSIVEYKNGQWTIDKYATDQVAVNAIEEMIDIQRDYDKAILAEDEAIEKFKIAYGKWKDAHSKRIMGFAEKEIVGLNKSAMLAETCKKVIEFFKDVPDFQVGLRFLNTLGLQVKSGGRDAAISYVKGYFDLQSKQDEADMIIAKMGATGVDSPEWDQIEAGIYGQAISTQINKRLKIYYGAAGTGKTTMAMTEISRPENVIVCNGSMDSNDLLYDFTFDENGKPQFIPGLLYKAAENGEVVLLDEINLLNDEVLRFLQGITDNKDSFAAKNNTIHIKPGFMVIGTMNLTVNGRCYPLPEPLIDRAIELKEFTLDATMLETALQ